MDRVGELKTPCIQCRSPRLSVYLGEKFDGIVLRCAVCGFYDFIRDPFADVRILLDVPKNWYLVFNP